MPRSTPMANDFHAQVREEVKRKLAELIDGGADPAQVRAMVPQLQAKVQERLTAYEAERREKLIASNQKLSRRVNEIEGESVHDQKLVDGDTGRTPWHARGVLGKLSNPMPAPKGFVSTDAYSDMPVVGGQEALDELAANPQLRRDMGGMAAGNAAGMGTALLLGPVVGKAVQYGPPLVQAGLRLLGGAGTGAVSGAVAGGTDAAVAGRDIAEGAESGGKFGALLGTGAQIVSEGARGVSALTRRDPHAARYLANKEVPMSSAGGPAPVVGVYDDPAMMSLPKGREGIQEAANMSRNRILTREEELARAAGAKYEAGEAALPGLDELEPMASVHRELNRSPAKKRYQGSGREVNAAAAKKIEDVKENLRSVTRQRVKPVLERDVQTNVRPQIKNTTAGEVSGYVDEDGKWRDGIEWVVDDARPGTNVVALEAGEQVRTPAATKRDLLTQRRAVQKEASFGSSQVTPETQAARDIYGTVDTAAKNRIPGLSEIDAEYTQFARGRDRRRKILRSSGDQQAMPDPTEDDLMAARDPEFRPPPAEEQAMAATVKKYGDDTEPGLRLREHLEELANSDPEFRHALEFVANKKAREAVRFSLSNPIPAPLNDAVAQLPFLGGAKGIAVQNARALGVALDPAAQAISRAITPGRLTGPVAATYQERLSEARRRDKERGEKLRKHYKGK